MRFRAPARKGTHEAKPNVHPQRNPATGIVGNSYRRRMGELIRLDRHRHRAPEPRPAIPEPLWREVVGRRLRALRQARDERLADTAARAGCSPQYLSELERGLKDPSSEILAAVAGALGRSLGEVVGMAHADLTRGGGSRGPVLLAA